MPEEFYNPSGYADYLENEHYHHSDKGCQIEMTTEMGTRPGEIFLSGVVKKCLTHNCVCSKTGWEKGWYRGTKSVSIICECGKELEGKNRLCDNCKKIHSQNSKIKEQIKRKELSAFARRWKSEKNSKIIN